MFSAKISTADVVSDENVDFINGNCTNATTGRASCVFNTGFFTTTPNCTCSAVQNADGDRVCHVLTQSTSSVALTLADNNTAVDKGFILSCQKTGVDALQSAYLPDTVANSWSGYHDNNCIWSRTSTSFGDFTADASCTLVEEKNTNFGSVTTAGAALPGIVFTPKKAGTYFVCGGIAEFGSSSSAQKVYQMVDGTTSFTEQQSYVVSTSVETPMHLCGLVTATDTSAKTIKFRGKITAGNLNISPGNRRSSIEWSIFKISENLPAPLLVNSVVSSSAGVVKVVSALITNSGAPTVTRQDGEWISSLTDNGTGDTTVNIAAGVFSSTPNCQCTVYTGGLANSCMIDATTAISSTAVRTQTVTDAGAVSDTSHFITCIGAP
jgi:hypothetical protein